MPTALIAAEYQVEAAATAVTTVGAANRRDPAGVPRGGQPIVYGSPDAPALDGRLTGPRMAGNKQNQPIAPVNGLVEAAVDGGPGLVEIVSV